MNAVARPPSVGRASRTSTRTPLLGKRGGGTEAGKAAADDDDVNAQMLNATMLNA